MVNKIERFLGELFTVDRGGRLETKNLDVLDNVKFTHCRIL